MSILSADSKDCFSLFKRSMIQSKDLPLTEILDDSFVKDVFSEEKIEFGNAYEDVFTPAITLWAMISQFLFSGAGRSVKAAAGRVVSLYAQVEGRVIAQNAGNYCRAKDHSMNNCRSETRQEFRPPNNSKVLATFATTKSDT